MHEAAAWYYDDDRDNSLCWHMSQMCWHYGLAFVSLLSICQFVFFFPVGSIWLAGRKESIRVTVSGAAEVLDVGFRNGARFRMANGSGLMVQGQCRDQGTLTVTQRLRPARNRQMGLVGGPGRAFPNVTRVLSIFSHSAGWPACSALLVLSRTCFYSVKSRAFDQCGLIKPQLFYILVKYT